MGPLYVRWAFVFNHNSTCKHQFILFFIPFLSIQRFYKIGMNWRDVYELWTHTESPWSQFHNSKWVGIWMFIKSLSFVRVWVLRIWVDVLLFFSIVMLSLVICNYLVYCSIFVWWFCFLVTVSYGCKNNIEFNWIDIWLFVTISINGNL